MCLSLDTCTRQAFSRKEGCEQAPETVRNFHCKTLEDPRRPPRVWCELLLYDFPNHPPRTTRTLPGRNMSIPAEVTSSRVMCRSHVLATEGASCQPSTAYLLLQPLQHGGQMGLPVLFIRLHLLGQLLFCHLDEVIVFLNSFLDHLSLVLSFLCEVFQELSFLVLGQHKKRKTL